MKKKNFIYFVILIITAAVTGCDSGYDCSLNNIAYNRIGFYSMSAEGIEKEYAMQDALTVSMMINGQEAEVIGNNKDGLRLPMSYTQECDTVLFTYEGEMQDTLYVNHSNIQFYQSMECGTVMYHRINSVGHTRNMIDSIAIAQNFVNFDGNENLKVYFIE